MGRGWTSEERYFAFCPICGEREAMVKMITLKKADRYSSKNLTKVCKNCYLKVLDFLGVNDVSLLPNYYDNL